MRNNFEPWIANLKEWEGFKSNDVSDAGGETVYGISRKYHPSIPWPPTWDQAKKIYLNEYWARNGCDNHPFPLDVIHADSCVNPGPGAAKEFLYQSGEHQDVLARCVEYLVLRQRYYLKRVRERPINLKYICGWMSRTLDIMQTTIITMWSIREI